MHADRPPRRRRRRLHDARPRAGVVLGRSPVITILKRCFPNPQYLLKVHLDFLMMTGLLFVFLLLFEHLRLTPPTAIVVEMSLGSVGNAPGFLALTVRPELPQRPTTPFGALMVLSFTATTVAYGCAAWSVAHAIVHTA